MKKNLVFIVFICILAVMIIGKNIISAQDCCSDKKKENNNCFVKDGVRFCASLTTINLQSGYKIVLNTSIKNITDKILTIPTVGSFYERYSVTIRDPSGRPILSNKELAETDIINNSNKEITSVPTISLRESVIKELAPQDEFKVEYNLNDFYKFETKGKYQFEIGSKLLINNNNLIEIKLEPLDIELK
jgi:hypothetical protein